MDSNKLNKKAVATWLSTTFLQRKLAQGEDERKENTLEE